MRRALFTAFLVVLLSGGTALAAGPFDGSYKGGAPSVCRLGQTIVVLTVANGRVSGTSAWSNGKVAVEGRVAADGSFHGTIGGERFEGKFEGNSFTASYVSPGGGTVPPGCKREMRLERHN